MIKPTKEWILVNVITEGEKTTESGIILPKAQGNTKKVRILAFGPEANSADLLKKGHIILCMKDHGIKINHEGKEYEFMKEKNFIGVVE
jgi:co-chaperonin GroES (HSP10)